MCTFIINQAVHKQKFALLDSKYQKALVAETLTDGKEIIEYKQLAALVASKLE